MLQLRVCFPLTFLSALTAFFSGFEQSSTITLVTLICSFGFIKPWVICEWKAEGKSGKKKKMVVRCNRVNQTDKQTNKQKFLVEEIRREEGRATYEANDDCSEDQFCQLLQI